MQRHIYYFFKLFLFVSNEGFADQRIFVQRVVKDATRNAGTISILSVELMLFNTLCFKMKGITNRKKFDS